MVEPSAEEKDSQEAARSTAEYAEYQKPQKPRNPLWGKLKPGRKLGIGLAILILVAVLGGGAYWFVKSRQSDKPAETTQTAQNSPAAAEKITTETKRFDSAHFKLSFDYPGNWLASEDNAEEISVLSNDLKLKGIDGKDVMGQIDFRIRAKGQKLQGLDGTNGAITVLDSEKIAYTSPTQSQRASTYISFVRYEQSSEGLDAIYITGDTGYAKGQTVPIADIEKVDPVVSVEFYLCPDSGCVEFSGVYGIGLETWNDESISGPLRSMLQSLIIN